MIGAKVLKKRCVEFSTFIQTKTTPQISIKTLPPTPSIKEFVRIGSTLKCELVQIPTLTEMLKGQIMGDSDQFQATSSKIIQSNFNALPAALLNSTRNSSLQ